jgi:hypothetical protein
MRTGSGARGRARSRGLVPGGRLTLVGVDAAPSVAASRHATLAGAGHALTVAS